MRSGTPGSYLFAREQELEISPCYDVVRLKRTREARPASSRVILVKGAKEGLSGHYIDIDARPFVVPVLIAERRFGALVLSHLVLLRCEPLAKFRIRRLARL
jgi:hypothetical protein